MPAIQNRYDFVFLFDVKNGNPNGDPDAGNMPRMDPETGRGLVTDVALKRKIRNYVATVRPESRDDREPGQKYNIYMRERAVLNVEHRRAYAALGVKEEAKKLPKDAGGRALTRWMCDNFFDIRTFGAVMSTEVNSGQVRGPVQLTFSESVEPIVPAEVSITRSSVTNEKDAEKNDRTMGRKHIVPYGLYRCHGFISASLAGDETKGTGFSDEDLCLLWNALDNMFDHDRAAARGEMATRRTIIFKHTCALGNAPAHALFDRVKIDRVFRGEHCPAGDERASNWPPARTFSDYAIHVEREGLPDGVEVIER